MCHEVSRTNVEVFGISSGITSRIGLDGYPLCDGVNSVAKGTSLCIPRILRDIEGLVWQFAR
jgi:hypothetical protein